MAGRNWISRKYPAIIIIFWVLHGVRQAMNIDNEQWYPFLVMTGYSPS
jgi:hypothetical protein